MSNFQKILDSFTLRDTLNPKIWDNSEDPAKSKMKPKVRKALMKIANEFIDYLGEDAFVEDITLTGSLSNFNWSEYSDFDLHVIVDLKKFGKQEETYKELFNLKKQLFNEKHDIKIFGYDVELYAQGEDEKHESSGVYSLMEDEWINRPQKMKNEIDKSVIEDKVKNWNEKIENALESLDKGDLEKGKKRIEDLKDKLKEYRKSGLEKEGELSYENLTFKFLRRNGMIEKLFNTYNNYIDQELSIEQSLKESIIKYLQEAPMSSHLTGGEISDLVGDSKFLQDLIRVAEGNKTYKYEAGKIVYDKDVEFIQTALQFLGFSLPKWGVDGKFGPETENAAKEFQKSMQITTDGKLDGFDLRYLTAMLVIRKFSDDDLSKIQKQKEVDTSNITDKNFYERILKELGAPVTSENLKFLYAWRQAEGKGGRYNPFNTTWKLPGSTNMNKVGVQHYKSLEDGMIATLKTLRNGRYNCIVDGMKNDAGATEISKCTSLKTWGTGDLVAKVVNSYEKGASPRIKDLA
jgi:peptidoglycan hydrolase-like protein with peptidoglycan-binding domain